MSAFGGKVDMTYCRRECSLLAQAEILKTAIDVAIGGKADMTYCTANVYL